MFKRIGPAQLTLVQNGAAQVDVRIQLGPRNEWRGAAVFPADMIDDAEDRISIIQTANDLEDLFREFGVRQAWESYQEFRAINGF